MSDRYQAWPGWPYQVVTKGTAGLAKLFCGLQVRGLGNVPASGAAVLMANHVSYLDPLLIAGVTSRPIRFVAKDELFEGFGGWLYPRLNTIPVKRGKPDVGAFRSAAATLDAGGLFCVFPEGTRSADGRLGAAQPGAISIAVKAGVPIVPIGLIGTWEVMPRSGRWRSARIGLAFGQPFQPAWLSAEAKRDKRLMAKVGALVMERIARLQEALREELAPDE